MPVRSFLLSTKLSVADVECPSCRVVMHAGRRSKRTIWAGLVLGGLFAAVGAYGAHQGLGWGLAPSIAVIAVVAILTGVMLTAYAWLRDDFHLDRS